MLTLFTTAKPFLGHAGIIQRNALESWKRLHPDLEVIMFGDEEGVAEVCAELGLRHEARVERHSSRLKFIDFMFNRAVEIAKHSVLCYVNCDIILAADFLTAVEHVHTRITKFLIVGRRWDTDIVKPVDFSSPKWSEEVRRLARETNNQRNGWWIDYFCFSRDLYCKQIPAFVIGRVCWDNWLVWKAIDSGAVVVDASSVVFAVHQNHGYSYHPEGQDGVWTDEHSQRNYAIAGGWKHLRIIADATTRLTPEGLKPNWVRHWHCAKRILRSTTLAIIFDLWLPVWHFCLSLTRPLRVRLGMRSKVNRQARQKESTKIGISP